MDNKKKITLQAYDIENKEIEQAYSDLQSKLKAKLNAHGMADSRRMKLNLESTEEDLLSDYAISELYVFGVIWRIAPAKEVPSIPDKLFENATIQINDIQDQEKNASLICKDHYYFSLNNHFLITNLPKSRVKSLQVYLNWLLESERGDKLYKITPKVKAPKDIKLSEIKNIVFTNPTQKEDKEKKKKKEKEAEKEKGKTVSRIFEFAEESLKKVIEDIPNLQKMIDSNILSAKLLVNFSKPRKMEEDDYERLLGAYMKPISDSDGVTFKLKDGKKISGSDILRIKNVEIEKIDDTRISEQELIQEMEAFLRELNNEL